ncbi:MAG: hypothetical protein K0R57_5284 [Paenibacillaceae bacterium]|nr:hypothetical protein [Paenibacillaceae bacterium]
MKIEISGQEKLTALFREGLPSGKLSKSHEAIANFVMGALDSIPYCTEEDIALRVGVSTPTVSRFWRSVGFDNLKAFKKHLQDTRQASPANKMQDILHKVSPDSMVSNMMAMAIDNLETTREMISQEAFYKAVRVLHESRTIYMHGAGTAAALTELLSFRLNRIGLCVQILAKSGHELFEKLVHADSRDAVVLFGFVRTSPEAEVILQQAEAARYRTILITDLFVSDMISRSHIALQVDRGDMNGFHSMVAPIALVDSLAVGVAGLRGEAAIGKLEQLHDMRKEYMGLIPK